MPLGCTVHTHHVVCICTVLGFLPVSFFSMQLFPSSFFFWNTAFPIPIFQRKISSFYLGKIESLGKTMFPNYPLKKLLLLSQIQYMSLIKGSFGIVTASTSSAVKQSQTAWQWRRTRNFFLYGSKQLHHVGGGYRPQAEETGRRRRQPSWI